MNKIRILIMGLPGSGKTFLAKRFSKRKDTEWLNADKVRKKATLHGLLLLSRTLSKKF